MSVNHRVFSIPRPRRRKPGEAGRGGTGGAGALRGLSGGAPTNNLYKEEHT
jgi:hypothetical protein